MAMLVETCQKRADVLRKAKKQSRDVKPLIVFDGLEICLVMRFAALDVVSDPSPKRTKSSMGEAGVSTHPACVCTSLDAL